MIALGANLAYLAAARGCRSREIGGDQGIRALLIGVTAVSLANDFALGQVHVIKSGDHLDTGGPAPFRLELRHIDRPKFLRWNPYRLSSSEGGENGHACQ